MKKTNWAVGLLGVRNAHLILDGIGLQKSNKQETNGTGGQTMRDRLIELLKKYGMRVNMSTLADYLLANGIICLPCKVGDKVYIVKSRTSDDKNLYIIEDVVKRIVFDKSEDTGFIHSRIEFFNTSSVSDWLFQNIFLTREEAEAKLKEREEKCLF